MRELVYQVEFLSDIVLPATSNTEGNITQLDFIPGSNFLGMVAKNYKKFGIGAFDVFHSGKVRFGDATILKDGKQTYKIPLSFFHEKLDDKEIFNHHKIEDFSKFTQLKQKRNGYITKELELVEINYNYSQKSAYDKTNRRSLDSSMYGYSAIESGTKWQFSIKCDDKISPHDLELIKKTIAGKQRLGKSKSAQYGLVKIEEIGCETLVLPSHKSDQTTVLYANSRLALIDEEANPTYDLKYLCDGLSDENIVYEDTQIRTSTFTPFNSKRATKDYERVCINKGSVIVLKNISDEQLKNIVSGVGAYLSDGFGEILVEPEFLTNNGFKLKEDRKDDIKKNQRVKINQEFADRTVQFLANRHNSYIDKLELANNVAKFIDDEKKHFPKKMNSQWGAIRSLCSQHSEDKIYGKIEKFISSGVAKDKWKDGKKETLLKGIEGQSIEFIKLLAIQMPKVKPAKESKND